MLTESRRKGFQFAALFFGIFLAFVALGAAEWIAGILYKEPPGAAIQYAQDYFFLDQDGITKPRPNGIYPSSSVSQITGKQIYNIVYSVDGHSRRITPALHPEWRTKHMIFFGCSFTYGEGLQDHETYPAQLALRARDYQPYNYAFHGHSPADMLAKLEAGNLSSEVGEKEGILFYLFIDAHVQRVVGNMRLVTSWGKDRPYYFLGKDGEPQRKGNFTTGRPILSWVYQLLAKSKLLKLLNIDFPPRLTGRHIELTARLIQKSARLYHEQFPKGRFIVVIHPISFQYGKRLETVLKEMNIETLNYGGLYDASRPEYVLAPEDLHPSALADETLAKKLVEDLQLSNYS